MSTSATTTILAAEVSTPPQYIKFGTSIKARSSTNIEADLSTTPVGIESETAVQNYRWIINPGLDLLFCCGGIVWLLFAVHYFLIGSKSLSIPAQTLISISAIGTIFLGETHTVASFVRLYKDEEFRARFPVLSTWGVIGFSALALSGCLIPQIPPVMAKLYLLIVAQHFTKQSYGIILLYCLKRNYKMQNWDKNILAALMQATMVFAIIKQFTYHAWSGDTFLEQRIPFWGPLPEPIFFLSAYVLAITLAAFFIRVCYRFVARGEHFPFPAAALTVTSVLIFTLGKEMTGTIWLYVPAFFHGSQYLTVTTSVYMKEQGITGALPRNEIRSPLLHKNTIQYFGFLVIAGVALFIGLPRILEQFGFNYAMAVCSIFTCVQFHHVLIDRAIWRLKDPAIRKLLVA